MSNDIMYKRSDEIESMFGPLDPREKALIWLSYSMARVDAITEHVNEQPQTAIEPNGIMNDEAALWNHKPKIYPAIGETVFIHLLEGAYDGVTPILCKIISITKSQIEIMRLKDNSYTMIDKIYIAYFEPYYPL